MFSKEVLSLDYERELAGTKDFIQEQVFVHFKRKGAVVGLSGGIDSAVIAELCVRALGKDKVLGVILPEKESNPISAQYGMKQADKMGIRTITVEITAYLEALGVYKKRNDVIKTIFPQSFC